MDCACFPQRHSSGLPPILPLLPCLLPDLHWPSAQTSTWRHSHSWFPCCMCAWPWTQLSSGWTAVPCPQWYQLFKCGESVYYLPYSSSPETIAMCCTRKELHSYVLNIILCDHNCTFIIFNCISVLMFIMWTVRNKHWNWKIGIVYTSCVTRVAVWPIWCNVWV